MTLSGVKKRVTKVHSHVAVKQQLTGSRFVCCPLCGDNIPRYQINEHIDASHEFPGEAQASTMISHPAQRQSQAQDVSKQSQSPEIYTRIPDSAAQQLWWQSSASVPAVLAFGKQEGSKKQTPLTDHQLRDLTPCEVVRTALPSKLADKLLQTLLKNSATWTRGTWYIGGKKHDAPRTSSYYSLGAKTEQDDASQSAKDVPLEVETQTASAELQEAAVIVNQHVNRLANRVQHQLTPEDREHWESSYALCNMYTDGQEGVGPHADRLTMLGPRPIIASLSLGATRTFRIRHQALQSDKHAPTGTSQGTMQQPQVFQQSKPQQNKDVLLNMPPDGQHHVPAAEASSRNALISADVQLPHNTLVIMWPPVQECYKHEVPKTKSVDWHPVAGTRRINLTFRRLKQEWADKAPCCRCNHRAVMKASLPSSSSSQQRYYYACDNTQGHGCGYFQWVLFTGDSCAYQPPDSLKKVTFWGSL